MNYQKEYHRYKKLYNNLYSQVFTGLLGGKKKMVRGKIKKTDKKKVAKVNNQKLLVDFINKNNIKKVEDILKMKDVDINKKDNYGNIPLHYAVTESPQLVELLIKKGSKINVSDNEGHTPLHVVVASNIDVKTKLKIMNALFENDIKVNKTNDDGNTALHFAVMENQPRVVKALVEEDAKLKIKNESDETPIDLALKYKRRERGKKLKKIKKIIDILDPKLKTKKEKDHIIITSDSSPIISFDDVSLSPTIVIRDDCNLNFITFLSQYFGYNFSQLATLLRYEHNDIYIMTKCKPGIRLPADKPSRFIRRWNNLQDFMSTYEQRLALKKMRQPIYTESGTCWSEPTIDLYLLFLMLRVKYYIENKRIRICPIKSPGNKNPRNKVYISPTYRININDGSVYSNSKIRQTFEELIFMLERSKYGAYLMIGYEFSGFGQNIFMYLS